MIDWKLGLSFKVVSISGILRMHVCESQSYVGKLAQQMVESGRTVVLYSRQISAQRHYLYARIF